jgi:hypothetical protein
MSSESIIADSDLEKIARSLAIMLRTEQDSRDLDDRWPLHFLRGAEDAASYLGISRSTLIDWQNTADPKKILVPRIINGRQYFTRAQLDEFMHPSQNEPGVETKFMSKTSHGL